MRIALIASACLGGIVVFAAGLLVILAGGAQEDRAAGRDDSTDIAEALGILRGEDGEVRR